MRKLQKECELMKTKILLTQFMQMVKTLMIC